MRILECTLVEFGAFKDRTFVFGDGLNIIEGGNESGKSTLLAFIKFMFYGAPRKSAGDVISERERILSWSGGVASGRMVVETADGRFRIERTLKHTQNDGRDSYRESVKLIDLATGEQIHKGEVPGEVFFGVPPQVFESTCAVRQARCAELNTTELGSSIENLLFTGDESLNTQRAATKLDSERRVLLHKNGKGGRLWELSGERQELRERLERARMTAAARVDRQLRVEELKKQAVRHRERLAVCEETCNNFENLALLRRFTQMHELEKKTAALRARLEELHRTRAHNGYLPDDAYLSYLRGLKSRLSAALEDRTRAMAQRERALKEAEMDERRKSRIVHAEKLRATGGLELALGQFNARRTAIGHLRLLAVIMASLGVILLAAGILGFWVMQTALTVCGILLAAGGVFSATAVLCVLLGKRKRGLLHKFLEEFGASPDCTEQALAGYLNSCLALARQHEAEQEQLQDANRLLAERDRVLGVVCSDCVQTLARMGLRGDEEEPEALFAQIDGALTEFSALAVEHGKVRREWERLDANLRDLRAELAGQNEAELRAHLTADQAQAALGDDIAKLRSERDYLRRAVSDADARRNEMEKQLVSLEAMAEDPGRLALELEELERSLGQCQMRHEALVLASEALALASARVRRGVTPRLRSGAGVWMSKLTSGRYTDLGISGTMSITVDADGETRPIEAMSGGTVDAAYLSLRLSLLEVLYGMDRPPLLLDESLCQLDDRRAEQFLTMLNGWCAAGAQCLLFTCQSREAKICRDVGYFEYVRLGG